MPVVTAVEASILCAVLVRIKPNLFDVSGSFAPQRTLKICVATPKDAASRSHDTFFMAVCWQEKKSVPKKKQSYQ